ncbi:MAG: S8 family serine peptidase [Proteobacteria bacterium]|jgi:subtilisin family serine protease|nr:S8 family serine peptidase [Pseudomonadota bacterium]
MDVTQNRVLLCGLLSGLLISCANKKSSSSVFPESSQGTTGCAAEKLETQFIVQWEDGRITVEKGENAELFKDRFISDKLQEIRHVEFDKPVRLDQADFQTEALNPQFFTPDNWQITSVKADQVWSQGVTGQGVTVAVVDAPVDRRHVQLRNQILINSAELNGRPGIDDDNNGFIDDVYGWDFFSNKSDPTLPIYYEDHGTHVAGIVGADHSTGAMRGIAPQVKILPVNFMSENGEGTLGGAIQAMKYAAARGAKIINASWGGSSCSQSLAEAVASLNSRGVLFVAASGNDGADFDFSKMGWVYPAVYNYSHQVTVAATNKFDYITDFSNKSFSLVHLGAPGFDIISTVNGGYYKMSGTSMATPLVSGASALLWSAKPQATAQQIKQALLSGVDVIPGKESKTSSRGRMNVLKSLDQLRRMIP